MSDTSSTGSALLKQLSKRVNGAKESTGGTREDMPAITDNR